MENKITVFEENQTQRKMYSTLDLSSKESGIKLFNATENCDELVFDNVGKELILKDVYVEQIPTADEETGEMIYKYRTILFDSEGKSYASGSYGLYNSVQKILQIFGTETLHTEDIKVRIGKRTVDGKTKLFLELV